MTQIKNGNRTELQEELLPVRIVDSSGIEKAQELLKSSSGELPCSVSFEAAGWPAFQGKGSHIVLDFGREICGGIRMIVRECVNTTRWRLTFGETVTEACSDIGEKNATNDHSPRDFEVLTSSMSDLQFGQTGFRFVRIELLDDIAVTVQNILAVSNLQAFETEAEITTNDPRINEIIKTAAYTLKLCFQKGYIWDGIKRDRLVWCGDLHPEIITSLYLFGDNENICNSLRFLRETTESGKWINWIPAYSAWWVINLCDYYSFTGNREFFEENREYAREILKQFDSCVEEDGSMNLTNGVGMEFFLDWPSLGHPDAVTGVAALMRWMAQKYEVIEENENCRSLMRKLSSCLETKTTLKQIRAFQILAGKTPSLEDVELLQQGGAGGISTFMAYYILTAMATAGGTDMLEIVKTYYGGMLDRGATTFWEDFDIAWLENSGRIDEFPAEGQKDIHGDFGNYCYQQFRHSLCHGWSSGVLSFLIEYVAGIHITDGGKKVTVNPHLMSLTDVEVKLPMKNGNAVIAIHEGDIRVSVPEGIEVDVR